MIIKWKVEITVFNSIILIYAFSILLSTIFLSYSFLIKNKVETKEFTVSIKGYYTRKVDGVIFEFKGKSFDRPFGLVNKVSKEVSRKEDFYKKYLLILSVKEFNFDIYYIDSIRLYHSTGPSKNKFNG